ncbi:MAG: AAC(3) family N-acetyltransferase, partial [Verrucomicrobia bacterium]|nr:AAC(3) family N-acetyltransferase [Verrucomicrobiota bacterium]
REHDENATAYLPYSRLAELRGKTLSIGIGDKLVGIRHEAQYLAGLLTLVPFKIGVRYRDDNGEIQLFIRRDKGGCVKRLPEFVPELRRQGLVKEGNVGIGASLLIPSQDILRVMVDLLKKNPALNVCGDISCLWCREVERRLALYDTIENPAYFQKSRLLRKLIAIRNGFRLRR